MKTGDLTGMTWGTGREGQGKSLMAKHLWRAAAGVGVGKEANCGLAGRDQVFGRLLSPRPL